MIYERISGSPRTDLGNRRPSVDTHHTWRTCDQARQRERERERERERDLSSAGMYLQNRQRARAQNRTSEPLASASKYSDPDFFMMCGGDGLARILSSVSSFLMPKFTIFNAKIHHFLNTNLSSAKGSSDFPPSCQRFIMFSTKTAQ